MAWRFRFFRCHRTALPSGHLNTDGYTDSTGNTLLDTCTRDNRCRVANNEDCHDGYLKTCPTDQAYDVCMTMVVKNAQQGFFIEKKCALGPCNLRDEKQSQGLGLDTCDRSKDSYSCFECCKGDGCNTNAARRRSPLLSMPPLLLLTAVLAGRRA
ncbi:hypothetical protein HPB52_013271 [Rhipicephalus sanguineus]|uniref:Uncharacterized protein n=1 Tax=Rhipicephalus sanguineus TaxID=34632 RepID=A0A9D4YPW4_RHISA|nr:hypothetical protein HPB52_013271 [Rhipicephalus sanguineus]